jgi:hypothetical protein
MKRSALCICLAAIAVIVPATAPAARASWVSQNCNSGTTGIAAQKRSTARAYGEVADREGYEWGGGCWNNDNKDDTPGQPDSNGEGPDCSGLTFKSWYLENSLHQTGWQKWGQLTNIHGPYSSYAFYAPIADDPFKLLPNKNRSTTWFMDAFVKQGHIGLLDTSANPSSQTDWILEAYGDSSGTDINERDYRYRAEYKAITREGWVKEDCNPYCSAPGRVVVTVP